MIAMQLHKKSIKMSNSIIPTKDNPTFIARCNWFGHIEGIYKETEVTTCEGTSCMPTFAITFADAIKNLLDYAKEEKEYLLSDKDTKLFVELVDGSSNEDGEVKFKKVFTLTSSQIKLL